MDKIFSAIADAVSFTSGIMYTYILVILLVAAGIYFTLRTRATQITRLPDQLRSVTEKPKDKKGTSSFQSLMVSTASRVGTGNIIGVSTAICIGGFGSVFWMWVIAIIGGATAFIESTLGQIYKRRGKDGSYGGPAAYIEQGLGFRRLASSSPLSSSSPTAWASICSPPTICRTPSRAIPSTPRA